MKKQNSFSKFLNKIIFIFIILIIVIIGIIIYTISNFDNISLKLAEKIDIKQERIALDSDHFDKLKIHLIISNGLPFEITFKSLNFEMTVDGYKVLSKNGKDNLMQAEAMIPIKSNVDSKTIITCDVGEPTVIKRAIQKAIDKNAGKIIKAVLSQKSVKKEIGDDIKAITNVNGTAYFMIKLGSLEIPFEKKIAF